MMSNEAKSIDVTDFLSEAAWLRRLAGSLVAPDRADDLVQDTWSQLVSSPPSHAGSPRGWLAQVARNVARMGTRSRKRREARESSRSPSPDAPDPEELVARSQRLRMLARMVEALDEPLRGTVLLHFFEGLPLAEIARRQGISDSTVRGRLRNGLRRLRAALDAEHDGGREEWLAAFAPFASLPAGLGPASRSAALSKVATVAVVAAVAGGAAIMVPASSEPASAPPEAKAVAEPATPSAPAVAPRTTRVREPVRTPVARITEAARLDDDAERRAYLAGIEAARLERLSAAGMGEEIVEAAKDDAKLLGDIEQMLTLEDASRVAATCKEASPPQRPGLLFVSVTFTGEPDIGTIVESVDIDDARSEPGMGEFAACVRESLYLAALPPPAAGGAQTLPLFFDTDAELVTVGVDDEEP